MAVVSAAAEVAVVLVYSCHSLQLDATTSVLAAGRCKHLPSIAHSAPDHNTSFAGVLQNAHATCSMCCACLVL